MLDDDIDANKREFLAKLTTVVGGVGAAATGYLFAASMLPTRAVVANATVEVDLSGIAEGTGRTISWQGSPVFIMHRSQEQIRQMQLSSGGKDPQADSERVQDPQWLILLGVCTHLGCIPAQADSGWRCPCHGSQFDNSGRIVRGPAPRNLEVPPYKFINKHRVLIGKA